MINSTDSRYKDIVGSPDEKRPVIESYEEFIKLALESAITDYLVTEDGEPDWNNVIRERFNLNRAAGYVNMRTFNKELAVRSTQATEIFETRNRLDEYISLCDDPAKKTMAMAVRKAAEPYFNEILSDELLETCMTQLDAVKNEYFIPDELEQELQAASGLSDLRKQHRNDIDACELSNLPTGEKLLLVSRFAKSFLDREAMNGVDFENASRAEKEFLDEVNKAAKDIVDAAEKGGKNAAAAVRESDARDVEALSSLIGKMNDDEKGKYKNAVSEFKSSRNFAEIDVSIKRDHVNLTLINSPMVEITADEFLEKQKNGTLSEIETEWGEASVDAMVKSLYTDDEYRELVRAGYDPAMGIMVDGKPLEWFGKGDFTQKTSSKLDVRYTANQKCSVVGKAMSGAKIDVYKLVPDGVNGYKKGDVKSVKTDLSMKSEKRSIFRWLLEFLGIVPHMPTIMENVNKANEAKREYLNTAMPIEKTEPIYIDPVTVDKKYETEMAKTAKRDEAATRLKVSLEQQDKKIAKFDKDFFSEVFSVDIEANNETDIEEMLGKEAGGAFGFNDFVSMGKNEEGEEIYQSGSILDVMDRRSSRVNMAILYGMTCGHSYDEMTEDSPEGAARRTVIGRAFVEELSVDDYDRFIHGKEFENEEAGRKAYINYVYDKREKAERFTLRAVEAIAREPVTRLDPFNHTQFSANYVKQHSIYEMAAELFQCAAPLKEIQIASTPETKALTNRSTAVFNYMSAKLNPIMGLESCARLYGSYMTSRAFVGLNESMCSYSINFAAEAKAGLQAVFAATEGCASYADIMYNEKLNNTVTTIAAQADICPNMANKDAAVKLYNYYLPTEYSKTALVTVFPESNTTISCGVMKNFKTLRNDAEKQFKVGVEAMKPYVDTETVIKDKALVSEAFEEMAGADKQARSSVVTFDDLVRKEIAGKANTFTAQVQKEEANRTAEPAKHEEAAAAEPKRITVNDITEKPKFYEKPGAAKAGEKAVEKAAEKKPPEKEL